jgi:hypothetical protein
MDRSNVLLYVNGALRATITQNGWPYLQGTQPLYIGSEGIVGAGDRGFRGAVDDVFIYNRALSPSEVVQLYNTENGSSGPWIITQPAGQSAQAGANVALNVAASGTPILNYQWRLNGQNIAGAISPTLTLTSVGAGNSGAYSVVVWNSYGSATSAAAHLTVSQPLTLMQTSRAPTPAESAPPCPALPAQFKIFANGAFGSTGTVSPAKQTIVFTHGWIPSVGPWALTQGYQGWPTDLAGALAAQGFGANANIVAWDWSSAAKSFPCNPGQAAGQTPTQGAALGQALLAALGPGYSHHIHFIGHSFGTMVNAGAANYLQAKGYSWMNTEMTLLDEAEIGTDVGCLDLFALALWSMPSSSQTCYQPLPLNCAWADNYVSLVGQLHPKAANVILSYGLPSAEPSILGLIVDAASFHAYPCTWYSNTIPNPNSAWMGFRWSFEEGGFAAAPAVGTVYLQSASGSQSDLVITDWTSASSLLSQRFQGYHAAAWLTGFADVSTLGTADGVVVGQSQRSPGNHQSGDAQWRLFPRPEFRAAPARRHVRDKRSCVCLDTSDSAVKRCLDVVRLRASGGRPTGFFRGGAQRHQHPVADNEPNPDQRGDE